MGLEEARQRWRQTGDPTEGTPIVQLQDHQGDGCARSKELLTGQRQPCPLQEQFEQGEE